MVDIAEGTLLLRFPAPWHAIKFDESAWYQEVVKTRVKSMDVLAVDGNVHWWIEIKDCFGHETVNRPRLSDQDPPEVALVSSWSSTQGYDSTVKVTRKKLFVCEEVVQKFEGCIASLAAAKRAGVGALAATEIQPYASFADSHAVVYAVLLLTWDIPDFGRLAMRLRDKLRQRMSAYNVTCYILNESDVAPLQPWTLSRLP